MTSPPPFSLAHRLTSVHLIPYPADTALSPPASYSHTTDLLIVTCALLYALCYFNYGVACVRDRFLPGPVEFLAGTMAYELHYAVTMTSSAWEFAGFLLWFGMDAGLAALAIRFAYPARDRLRTALRTAALLAAGLLFFRLLCARFPDDRDQRTAYWTGWLLETPIGWGQLYYLLARGDTRGQSLEIWICRFLGCLAANAVFMWRYLNVPQNWDYVGSWPSLALVALTILPELVYPFVYIRVHRAMRERELQETKVRKVQ